MPVNVLVPPLSQTMDALVLIGWLKQIGDSVVKGEPLLLVETDKATLEVESPASGILHAIYAQPQEEIKVRSSIGLILEPGEAAVQAKATEAVPMGGNNGTQSHGVLAGRTVEQAALPPMRIGWIFASPRARKLAREEGIALTGLQASGPRHMIVERDVRSYLEQQARARAEARKVTPVARRVAADNQIDIDSIAPQTTGKFIKRADVELTLQERESTASSEQATSHATPVGSSDGQSRIVKLTNRRKTIARRMQESHASSAPVTLNRLLDATELTHLRERLLKEIGDQAPRPTYTDLLVKIAAHSLLQHPDLNATFDGENLEMFDEVHMGLAVDTERGLVVPVIRSAQRKGVLELAGERTELVSRASQGTLTPDELSGGTFSLSNLGALGIDSFTPIINPPQIAILGVGRIYTAPAAYEGQIALREMLNLSLTFDHRWVDGVPAARLLQEITRRIENPDLIWL